MSRAWLIREALAEGFVNVVEKARERLRAGLVPRGGYWPGNVRAASWAALRRSTG